ncbi:MAG TPA: hypothetical protein VKA46_29490 [Gemmataceae bacterium]|nr:hypothetical protein [Gemmataceae bacterium]
MTSLRARAEGETAPLYGTALAGQKTNPLIEACELWEELCDDLIAERLRALRALLPRRDLMPMR